LRKVANDDFEACDVYDQFISIKKNLYISKISKEFDMNGNSSNVAVIMISGSRHNLGEVINANNELFELLGYNKDDVHGSSINRLMPQSIAAMHDKKLIDYITQNKERSGLSEIVVFALHKNGVMIPTIIRKKAIPNLHSGIQFIGFLCKANDFSSLIPKGQNKDDDFFDSNIISFLTDDEWRIHGINEKACQLLNISPENINIHKYFYKDQKFSLLSLFPQLSDFVNIGSNNQMREAIISVNIGTLQNEINASIDKYTTEKEEHMRDNICQSVLQVRIYEHIYEGSDDQNVRLCLIKIEANGENTIKNNSKEDEKSSFFFELKKEKSINIELMDNQSQSASSSTASGLINTRIIRELKLKVHSQQWITLLLIFLRTGIIMCLALIIIGGIFLI
jgi:PAS domain S-box-containing protein